MWGVGDRAGEARDELHRMLSEDELRDAVCSVRSSERDQMAMWSAGDAAEVARPTVQAWQGSGVVRFVNVLFSYVDANSVVWRMNIARSPIFCFLIIFVV